MLWLIKTEVIKIVMHFSTLFPFVKVNKLLLNGRLLIITDAKPIHTTVLIILPNLAQALHVRPSVPCLIIIASATLHAIPSPSSTNRFPDSRVNPFTPSRKPDKVDFLHWTLSPPNQENDRAPRKLRWDWVRWMLHVDLKRRFCLKNVIEHSFWVAPDVTLVYWIVVSCW